MATSGVKRTNVNRDNASQQRLLDEFAGGCQQIRPTLELPAREASFLAGIAAT